MRLPILVALALTMGVGESAQGHHDSKPLIRAKPSYGRHVEYRMFQDYESGDVGKAQGYFNWTRRSEARGGIAASQGVQSAAVAEASGQATASHRDGESTGMMVLGSMTRIGEVYLSQPSARRGDGVDERDVTPLRIASSGGWFSASGGVSHSPASGGGSAGLLGVDDPAPVTPPPPASPDPLSAQPALAAAHMPEPGTWLMLILGFGAVGAALRRRMGQLVRIAPA